MGKLLPIILMIIGGAVGGGVGFVMKPPPEMACDEAMDTTDCEEKPSEAAAEEMIEDDADKYYLAMKNQFVIPVIREELVRSLVVLSLSLETSPDHSETLFSREPKIRDVLLQVLFDHSHIGGFDGAFTESSRLSQLKVALLEATQSVVGPIVTDVVITDIVRQEI